MTTFLASAAGTVAVVYVLFILAYYVVTAISLQKFASRTGTTQGWMAWVPILNVFLYVRVCGRSGWEGILMFVPLVNVVYGIAVAIWLPRTVGRSGWWALGLLIPPVNVFAMPYLAFSGA
jgi:hypothetical protein